MDIYNTLTKQLEPLPPPEEQKKLNMFVCGPTVYDYVHLGNARTFVFFDVVAKYLKYKGYDIRYIQNITDIDNKIIERAGKEGLDPMAHAGKFTAIFKEDMAALGVTSPEYKNAMDHIPEVIKQVQTLLDKGHAYVLEGDGIYFDLSTFPDYGKLSGRTMGMANDAVSRIDDSDRKRNRGDFALWKFAQHNDPSWPAPFGAGRPGWHIEDTAITEKYFGPQYDIHGGGQDLIFPHHEAEIAQQESASGLKPFVKYWMHTGFLVNKDEKMSKSAGNFMTLNEALKKYSPEVLRFYFLSAHYHSPLNYSDKLLQANAHAVRGIYEFLSYKNFWKENIRNKGSDEYLDNIAVKGMENIVSAMENDFNASEAIGYFMDTITASEPTLASGYRSEKLDEVIRFADKIWRIIPKLPAIPKEIKNLAQERENARKKQDWDTEKQLKQRIIDLGYTVDDTPKGPLIKKT